MSTSILSQFRPAMTLQKRLADSQTHCAAAPVANLKLLTD